MASRFGRGRPQCQPGNPSPRKRPVSVALWNWIGKGPKVNGSQWQRNASARYPNTASPNMPAPNTPFNGAPNPGDGRVGPMLDQQKGFAPAATQMNPKEQTAVQERGPNPGQPTVPLRSQPGLDPVPHGKTTNAVPKKENSMWKKFNRLFKKKRTPEANSRTRPTSQTGPSGYDPSSPMTADNQDTNGNVSTFDRAPPQEYPTELRAPADDCYQTATRMPTSYADRIQTSQGFSSDEGDEGQAFAVRRPEAADEVRWELKQAVRRRAHNMSYSSRGYESEESEYLSSDSSYNQRNRMKNTTRPSRDGILDYNSRRRGMMIPNDTADDIGSPRVGRALKNTESFRESSEYTLPPVYYNDVRNRTRNDPGSLRESDEYVDLPMKRRTNCSIRTRTPAERRFRRPSEIQTVQRRQCLQPYGAVGVKPETRSRRHPARSENADRGPWIDGSITPSRSRARSRRLDERRGMPRVGYIPRTDYELADEGTAYCWTPADDLSDDESDSSLSATHTARAKDFYEVNWAPSQRQQQYSGKNHCVSPVQVKYNPVSHRWSKCDQNPSDWYPVGMSSYHKVADDWSIRMSGDYDPRLRIPAKGHHPVQEYRPTERNVQNTQLLESGESVQITVRDDSSSCFVPGAERRMSVRSRVVRIEHDRLPNDADNDESPYRVIQQTPTELRNYQHLPPEDAIAGARAWQVMPPQPNSPGFSRPVRSAPSGWVESPVNGRRIENVDQGESTILWQGVRYDGVDAGYNSMDGSQGTPRHLNQPVRRGGTY